MPFELTPNPEPIEPPIQESPNNPVWIPIEPFPITPATSAADSAPKTATNVAKSAESAVPSQNAQGNADSAIKVLPSVTLTSETPPLSSSRLIASAAKSIRDATYKDSHFDTGTDEEKINTVLNNLTKSQRSQLETYYEGQFDIPLIDELRSELSGVDLQRSENLLQRKDNQSNAGAHLTEDLAELNHWISGRSRHVIAGGIRERLAGMSAKDIENMDKQLGSGLSARDLINKQTKFDATTKEVLGIYLKGNDKITSRDIHRLADIAIETRNEKVFGDVMKFLPPSTREHFLDGKDFKGLLLRHDRPSRELSAIEDYLKYGQLGAPRLVRDCSGYNDDEAGIERALNTMSDEERKMYVVGKQFGESGKETESWTQYKSLTYYENLQKALKGAGNTVELLKWDDLASIKGGTLVAKLCEGDSRGILERIEKMSPQDWQVLKNDPGNRYKIERVINQRMFKGDSERAMSLVDQKKQAPSYEESLRVGKRSAKDTLISGMQVLFFMDDHKT
ncbi:MAG: annexin, partial [Cyanobacteria bacterium]|nr:annexin [Cyanobacteriota bacterium]